MTKHPSNKFQRKIIAEKKSQFIDEKKTQKDRGSKVWRKLSIEEAKAQEFDHELKMFGIIP